MTTDRKIRHSQHSDKAVLRSAATAKAPRLAKLTLPRLHAVIERSRLFDELDLARSHPVVWLAAHPGAGKTTLVGTWLEARNVPDLWFRVDSGDADPATFFLYLARCVEGLSAVRSGRTLPLLTPEHLADLPAFGASGVGDG